MFKSKEEKIIIFLVFIITLLVMYIMCIKFNNVDNKLDNIDREQKKILNFIYDLENN